MQAGNRYFIRVVLAVIAVLIGYTVVYTVWNNTARSRIAEVLFRRPDGIPCTDICLLGIQPGLTTKDDAVNLLSENPLMGTATVSFNADHLLTEKNDLTIWAALDQQMVTNIVVQDFDGITIGGSKLTWNTVHTLLGTPSLITASRGDGGMVTQAVAVFPKGWCVHARPIYADMYPLDIAANQPIEMIDVHCSQWRDLTKKASGQ